MNNSFFYLNNFLGKIYLTHFKCNGIYYSFIIQPSKYSYLKECVVKTVKRKTISWKFGSYSTLFGKIINY